MTRDASINDLKPCAHMRRKGGRLLRIDGSERRRRTEGPLDDKWASWSPDGQWDIYTIGADGSGLKRLTNGSNGRP